MINVTEQKELREKSVLPLILGCLIFMFSFYLFTNEKAEIAESEKSIDSVLKKFRKTVSQKIEYDRLVESCLMLDSKMKEFENSLPAESSIPQIITSVASLSSEAGLTLSSVNYSIKREEEARKEFFPWLKMETDLSGEYHLLRKFIKSLDSYNVFPVEITLTSEKKYRVKLLKMLRPEA
ncbi:MAG: type 4a pilus biogenesis protein PilO [Candidatus Riflebacteria bacterium]|nr:type 4a pilus biogenesis protein PilO [Candidatus Riflebacteria bacterium]